jgi:hypothetical protein
MMSGHLVQIKWMKSTVQDLLYCKLYIGLTRKEFYDKIKGNREVIKKMHSSEKYA